MKMISFGALILMCSCLLLACEKQGDFNRLSSELSVEIEKNELRDVTPAEIYPQYAPLLGMVKENVKLTIALLESDNIYSRYLGCWLLLDVDKRLDDEIAGYLLGIIIDDLDPSPSIAVLVICGRKLIKDWFVNKIYKACERSKYNSVLNFLNGIKRKNLKSNTLPPCVKTEGGGNGDIKTKEFRAGVAAQGTVNADSPVKSTGNEENHEVQEGTGKK
jgi:hypothetical protein